jgi:hypothetical protein
MPKPVGSVNFSADEVKRLHELADAGISMVEAARRLRRHPTTVSRRVRDVGLEWTGPPRRPPKPPWVNPHAWTEADDRWLLALAEAGWTQGLAANEMDRPINTLLRHSKLLGVRWPQGSKSRKGAPVERQR